MQFLKTLGVALSVATTVSASPLKRHNSEKRYAILDNDWSTAGFIPFLLAAEAGIEILALTSCKFFPNISSRHKPLTLCSNLQHMAEAVCLPRSSHA